MTATQPPLFYTAPKPNAYWTAKLHGAEFKLQRMQESPAPDLTCDTPERAVAWLRPQLPDSVRYNSDTENLIVIHLNTRRRPIGWAVISNGTLDTLLVHVREVFRAAIVVNASAILLAHNHPSGDPTPSEADIKVTRDLIRAGQLLKIDVLDHVILGQISPACSKGYSSLRELGYFYNT